MALDADLAPVVEAMPGWAGRDVRAEALGGGITNRNFRVDVDGETFVVRLPGKDTDLLGIARDAEHRAARSAHEAGVAPEVVAFLPQHGVLVTRFVRGDPLPPDDLERPEIMAEVVESIRRIHGMRTLQSTFNVFRVVREYRQTAEEHGVRTPVAFADALTVADRIADAFAFQPSPARPCHNDLLNANFLVVDGRVVIVDYEYAGMGDLFFDLGNFSINNGISEQAQERLMELYFGAVRPAGRARLKLMRIMSDFREAMWGVVQQGISSLGFDYVGYAYRHFARCLESAGDERFGSWLEDARGEP